MTKPFIDHLYLELEGQTGAIQCGAGSNNCSLSNSVPLVNVF